MESEGIFPKRTLGWLFLIVLGTFFYGFYYNSGLYQILHQKYSDFYQNHITFYLDIPDPSSEKRLFFQIDTPKHISESGEQFITIKISNRSPSMISGRLKIKPENPSLRVTSISKPEQTTEGYIAFQDVEISTNVDTTEKFQILLTKPLPQEVPHTIFLTFNDIPLNHLFSKELIFEVNSNMAMKREFLRYILIPPWSNGLLLFAALIIVKVTEDYLGFTNINKGDKSK